MVGALNTISIRELTLDDLEIFRDIRLRALKRHENYFLTTYEEAKKRPEEEWKETLDGKGKRIFGLFDEETLIGITAIFTSRDDPSGQTGLMAMSYIEPDYRGQGLSALLYEARINWALEYLPFKKLSICHRVGNEPSKAAMIKHGFQYVGTKRIKWPDGTEDDDCKYELDLEELRRSQCV